MGLSRLTSSSFPLLAGLILFAAGCTATSEMRNPSVESSVVALIDQEPISLSEFERKYARTVGSWEAAADDSMAAYRDFLDRYVNFRLKVRAAKEAGYEESASIRSELANYRNNFARPQLLEQEVLRPLARDLYEKQQELVDVSHILIQVEQDATPEDTLEAYRTIQALEDSLKQEADFGELALRHSDDPSATRQPGAPGYRGHLGYLPPGRVVKKFEDVAYDIQPGNYSAPFRTRYGYHILKVHERRPAPPQVRAAHIMLRPDRQSASDSTQLLNEARQLQDSLKAGVSFETLARRHSDDPRSARQGGALGNEISYHAQLPEAFKEAAFNLEEVGDVSEPVRTRFGYHLIKLLDRTEQPPFEEAYESLKGRIKKMPRYEQARQRLTQQILKKHEATIDTTRLQTAFARSDSPLQDLAAGNFHGMHPRDTFATLGDSAYVLRDLQRFAQNTNQQVEGNDQLLKLANQLLANKALTYQTHVLEASDGELGNVMQEFRSGLLLFQFMEDSVWTAAQQDTMGLRAYYHNHASEYRYPERIRAIGFVSSSDSLLDAVNAYLDAERPLNGLIEEFRADSTAPVRIDTVMVTDSTNSVFDHVRTLEEGAHTAVLDYQRGSRVIVVHDGVLPPRKKTFKEARPEVVNDYQEVLEDRLIERLRERYQVHLYPEHLTDAFKGPKPEEPSAPAASR